MCKSNIETAYLIVGANGFVGSYMIKNILEKTNKKILALDCDILGKENIDRLEWIKCDVTDQSDIEKVKKEINYQKELYDNATNKSNTKVEDLVDNVINLLKDRK